MLRTVHGARYPSGIGLSANYKHLQYFWNGRSYALHIWRWYSGKAWQQCFAISPRSFAVNGPRRWNSLLADLRTPDTTLLLQASSQGPPVSAVVYAAAELVAQHRSSGAVVTSEFGAVYKYSDLLTYLLTLFSTWTANKLCVSACYDVAMFVKRRPHWRPATSPDV